MERVIEFDMEVEMMDRNEEMQNRFGPAITPGANVGMGNATAPGALTAESLERAMHQTLTMRAPVFTNDPTFNQNFGMLRGFDEMVYSDGEDLVENTPNEPFTPNPYQRLESDKPKKAEIEKADKLFEASQAIYREIDARRQDRNKECVTGGNHEQAYLALAERHQRDTMTIEEVMDSDMPVPMNYLSNGQLRALQSLRHKDIMHGPKRNQYAWRCSVCAYQPCQEDTFFLDGRVFCSLHVADRELCTSCGGLKENCALIPQFDGGEAMLCERCLHTLDCRDCGGRLDPDHVTIRFCGTCLTRPRNPGTNRQFSRGIAWIDKHVGHIMKSPRVFSCEIEAGVQGSTAMTEVARNIPIEAGMGHDGSIKGFPYPFEIQSPRLAGLEGEEFIHLTTQTLHKYKAMINDSCGLHIHLDGKGIISPSRKTFPAALLQLWKAYLVFEDVTLSFLPYSRRRNDYCRPMNDSFRLEELNNIGSLLDAEKLWYKERGLTRVSNAKEQHRHISRYFGVNMHSLLSDGHLEIRYHSGTTNPRKILEWANLHSLIMDAATARVFTNDFLREAQATSSLKEKTQMLFTRINLTKESQQYFRERQRKFQDKKQVESTNNNPKEF